MRTARFSGSGSLPNPSPGGRPHPRRNMGTRERDPPEGKWDQTARQEVKSYRDPTEQNDRHM